MLYTLGGLENLQTAKKYYASVIDLTGGKNIRALFGINLVSSLSLLRCIDSEIHTHIYWSNSSFRPLPILLELRVVYYFLFSHLSYFWCIRMILKLDTCYLISLFKLFCLSPFFYPSCDQLELLKESV